jgi:2-dehydrotetronate isomerase
MLQFAANLSMLYGELPFLDRFAAAARDGFTGVEFWSPYAYAPSALAARLADNGLKQVLINTPAAGMRRNDMAAAWDQGERGTLALRHRSDEFRAGVEEALHYAHTLQCPQVHVMAGITPSTDERSTASAIEDHVAQQLQWACMLAAQAGVQLLLEPINPHDMPGYWLQRQDQAHALIQAVQSPQLRVLLGVYHCHRVEGDAIVQLQQAIPTGRVGHIQIASLPARQEPCADGLYYPQILQTIASLDYSAQGGWIGCEYRPAGTTQQGLDWLRQWREVERCSG